MIKRIRKKERSSFRVVWLAMLSLLFLAFPTQEVVVKIGIEDDRKKSVRTAFAHIWHRLMQATYLVSGTLATFLFTARHPKEFWFKFLRPEMGVKIKSLRDHQTNKQMKRKREMEFRESLIDVISFWITEIWQFTWYGHHNFLLKPNRLHYKNAFMTKRADIYSDMQRFLVHQLGEVYGIAIMKLFHSTTYYFSTSGNNTNNGFTEETAKGGSFFGAGSLNTIAFSAGDVIRLHCGDNFSPGDNSNFIQQTSCGTSGNPITWTTYGSGEPPEIPTFYIEGGNQRCWHVIGPFEASARNFGVVGASPRWWEDFSGRSDYTYIKDVTITNAGQNLDVGILCYGGQHVEIENVTIITDNVGMYIEAAPAHYNADWYIHDCTIYPYNITVGTTVGAQDGISIHSDGGANQQGSGFYIVDCEVYGFTESCLDINSGSDGFVIHNLIYGSNEACIIAGFFFEDLTIVQNFIQYNYSSGYYFVLEIDIDGATIYNNILENTCSAGRGIMVCSSPSAGFNGVGNVSFIHNTCTTVAGMSRGVLHFIGDNNTWITDAGNMRFQNNVFVTKAATGSTCIGRTGYTPALTSSVWDFDYNWWYQGSTALSFAGQTWNTWTATYGHDAHGGNTDPLLVDVTQTDRNAADYGLQEGSPCIETGVAITTGSYYSYNAEGTHRMESTTGISKDYYAFDRSLTVPSIGALEYGASTTIYAPTVTTQAVSSISFTTSTGNGNITNTGGENCTVRGVQVNTSASAIGAADFHADGDYGTGAFTQAITGLNNGTTYYVRAYATNSEDTGYGSWVSFTSNAYGEITIESGDTWEIADTDDWSEWNFTVESGGTLIWEEGASFALHNLHNLGTVGAEGLTFDTVTIGTVSGCGDYLGDASAWEPADCNPNETTKTGAWSDVTVWSWGTVPASGEPATLKAGHTITLGANRTLGSLICEAGTIVGGGYTLTCDFEDSTGYALDLHLVTVSGVMDVNIATAFDTKANLVPADGHVRNVVINTFDHAVVFQGNHLINGRLTITDGSFVPDADARTLYVAGISGSGTLGTNTWTGKLTNTSTWTGTVSYLHGNQELAQIGAIQSTISVYDLSAPEEEIIISGTGSEVTLEHSLIDNPDINVFTGGNKFLPTDSFQTTGNVYVEGTGVLGYTNWTPTADVEIGSISGDGIIYLPIDTTANLVVSDYINWRGTTNQATEKVEFTGVGAITRIVCASWSGLDIAEPTTHTHITTGDIHTSATLNVSTDKCISYVKSGVWYIAAGSTNYAVSTLIAAPTISQTVHLTAGILTDDDGSLRYRKIYADVGEMHFGYARTDDSRLYYKTEGASFIIDAGITLISRNCYYNGSLIQDNTTGATKAIDSIGSGGSWTVYLQDNKPYIMNQSQVINYTQIINADQVLDNIIG